VKRVLVISPHPDDEAIGCGGTLRHHIVSGDEVHVLFLTSGEQGGHGRPLAETIIVREAESAAAKKILGIHEIEFYHLPDGAVRATPSAVARLSTKLRSWRPDIIYVPHTGEMHPDHKAAARMVRLAVGGIKKTRPIVLMYEVWTPLQHMDEIVDITAYAKIKRQAIRAYRSQCAVMSFDDAALGLNRYRGEMFSWPEGEYAEVFARLDIS
jgi:LmbE family N-acetylglucosaminyl deacetylase